MNVLKVVGGLILISIVASNIGHAVGIRKVRAEAAKQSPKVGE